LPILTRKRARRQGEWDFYRRLGLRITARRRALGIRREELALLTASALQSIHFWERGERGLGAAKLQLIADALGLTVTELIGDAADELTVAASGQCGIAAARPDRPAS
jgi:transcriptional regulator with XRE-family HTH domain